MNLLHVKYLKHWFASDIQGNRFVQVSHDARDYKT